MRFLIVLAIASAARAQVEQPAAEPVQIQPLVNAGKPMVVDYQCGEEDIRLSGLTCTIEDPCPVYLELASVETVGNRIFLAGNIHTSSTTLTAVLLSSDDAGKTWREPQERIRLAGFDRIQFIDFENGWVSGEALHPLPHDPFLLVTTDAGKTWQSRPVYGDSQFGAILQFWFSSRTNGSLVIDRGRASESGRYELYDTSNAGDTWTLRQAGERPVPLKRASETANADWRLRADAASKSYHIERRAGGAWRSVAAFSVSIGACKPPEMPPPVAPSAEPIVDQRWR
ncbi:MAG TPA: hypothetical protein VMR62_36700 [Bryobacteraceae bacterium]|jgi:hypothetical protein|nr:hypothetical protein [Bryobacteraceae bacterium]